MAASEPERRSAAEDGLPPLRDVIRDHDLGARKSLGQNFILDLNITDKIVRAVPGVRDGCVIEVGPGPGGLTRSLLSAGARKVIAIERDDRCARALDEIARHHPGKLDIVMADALTCNFAALAAGEPTAIVANLPYNIATPLIVAWLKTETWPPFFTHITVMVQREVAERLVAGPSTPQDYGRLGVLTGWRCSARILFNVPPTVFTPQPKVMSSVVQLVPRPQPLPCETAALEQITFHAFGQRRKMLRQSLKAVDGETLLAQTGIDGTRRAETLEIAECVALANAFTRLRARTAGVQNEDEQTRTGKPA
jgi:16S rRNA (adenine1518-N6/adenine1519-N6)-dimethyltransferase